ncbi:AraC family transcriptional regulator [Paracoccus versutus]|uniref:AraC-like DNA-binding protein n=1 Tax=Paracoccus versutus TaxID=34007 RepID=A0AAQ0HHM7_PARVE|nr:AraC family transcriptional regulator [Paracoccus versutus]KGJ08608.1 hypothetical protein IT40_18065 [Paracoccus versutus]REG45930.1 AraC-like DNA-binding protein [Paracoccus versutus]WEJ77627.1 AraC family transcriptional regulator [Paracoccus versutus]
MPRLLGLADLEFLEAILEPLPDCPFFVKNDKLRYVAANSSMAKLCGVRQASDLIGGMAGDFFPPHLAQYYEQLDLGVLAAGTAVTNHLHLTSTRRSRRAALLFTRTPVRDVAGTTVGVCGTARWLADTMQLRRLVTAADHVREHFEQPLELHKLAEMAEISPSQLERDFKKVFGTTLRDFQHKLRLGHAIQLLQDGTDPIAEVAQACGYSDQSAFTRRFRSQMGLSPGAFRRRLPAGG